MSILLNLLLSALRTAVSRQTARAVMARMAFSYFLVLTSIVLALAALGFGLYAAFISLASLMSTASAAGLIAAAAAVIAAALAALAFRRSRTNRHKSDAPVTTAGAEAMASLVSSLSQWVRANPGEATAVAFAIGFVAGSRR